MRSRQDVFTQHVEASVLRQALRLIPRRCRRVVRRLLGRPAGNNATTELTCSIGIYAGNSPLDLAALKGIRNPVLTAADVTDRPAQLVADPFMVVKNGTWNMFFEVYDRETERGVISLATSPDARVWTYQGVVMMEDFHLSYPYVFEWDGDQYMIPECGETGCVRLYVANRFPREWAVCATLLKCDVPRDASVFEYGGRWWMLVETSQGRHDTTRLFHASTLIGPWVEHPRSPIIEYDAHIARPAGRVIEYDGCPLRLAQDCQPTYGNRVWGFQIKELTRQTYNEIPATSREILAPAKKGWNRLGMHHVDAHKLQDGRWLACVDGFGTVLKSP